MIRPSDHLILAFDPSISSTGYAILRASGRDGTFVAAGRIWARGKGLDIVTRIDQILTDAQAVVDEVAVMNATHASIVIETPQTETHGKTRSASTLPTYGMAVGALVWGLVYPISWGRVTVSATEWTKGAPATGNDKYKVARVRFVEQLYRLKPGSLGAKTTAGDVADAVLIARWMVRRTAIMGRLMMRQEDEA